LLVDIITGRVYCGHKNWCKETKNQDLEGSAEKKLRMSFRASRQASREICMQQCC
jgi:hypothetical protein